MIALAIIAAAAGLALSGVYSMTKPVIEDQELQAKAAAYKAVCPDAESFEALEAADKAIQETEGGNWKGGNAKVNEFFVGKDAKGNVAGYAVSVTAKGFGGNVTMAIGLNPDGTIRKISFTELTETAGLGMRADEDVFKNQFEGKGGTLNLVKGDASGANDISAISGATVTSTAVINGVNTGLDFFETVVKGGN